MTKAGRVRRAAVAAAALAACLPASPAGSLDLETVLARTAVEPPARVAFTEQRYNRMLKEPLVLTGYLEYLAEGELRKVVESPFEESLLVASGRVEVTRDGETRAFSLARSKSLLASLQGIEAILSGRPDALARAFDYELSGDADAWTLRLEPRSRRMRRELPELRVTGDDRAVSTIRIVLADGEWHLLTLLRAAKAP